MLERKGGLLSKARFRSVGDMNGGRVWAVIGLGSGWSLEAFGLFILNRLIVVLCISDLRS